jgi:tetratricopeptide (TPR) repeat protein
VIEDIDRQGLEDIEENIKKDLRLLKKYEEELRLETDPRRLENIRRNIQRQHESVRGYRQEYEELNKKGTSPQAQNISNLLQQQETKLDEVQKMLPPIWKVPHIRNTHFTGREDILHELRAALISGETAAWKQAVTGMGGVGKTQIALEYLYRHRTEYQIVWWIRSEESATMAADYASLAKPLDLPEKDSADQSEIVRAVKSWLEHNSGWLLIFDNAQDTNEMGDYLPQAGGGHVIITSRNPSWSKIAKLLPAKVFDRTESIDFLCRRTGQDDKEAADMLAKELGDLPLALEQAGAYIEETSMSLAAYCELFQSRRQELWGEESPPMGYPQAVGATWSLAMDRVSKESPEVAYLLNLCSYLAPDDIPMELLRKGKEHLPEPLASAMADQLIMNRAVRGLSHYSLIESKDENLSVHRLVQAVVRDRLDEDDKKDWAKIALNLVNEVFPYESDDVRTWPLCSILIPHALVAAAHAEVLKVAPGETYYILNQIGTYLRGRADFKEAKGLYTRALHPAEQVYGPDDPKVAINLNNLGRVLQDLGDLQGAKKNFERALAIGEAVYGPDHPTAAIHVGNLGSVLQDLGDLQGAKKNFERALAIDEAVYGPDHPDVAIDVNNLGNVLQDLGDLKGAKKNYERALAIDEAVYGPDHPTVAIRVNNLGNVLQDLGDMKGAKKNYERALAIDEAVYGPDHPDVAIDVNNLGRVLQDLGDLKGAKKKIERALAIDEAAYGSNHPNVAIDVGNLGRVLQDLGDMKGAKKKFERVLAIDEAVYGPDRPNVAIHVNNLGGVLRDLGDLQGAKKNFERALAIFSKFLGEDHPHTVTVRNNLEYLESQLES